MRESAKRSIAKTVSWRVSVSALSFMVSWWVTGSAEIAGLLMISKIGLNTVWFYAHERLWNRWNWGVVDSPKD
jgi:uncharacterized membrane protein